MKSKIDVYWHIYLWRIWSRTLIAWKDKDKGFTILHVLVHILEQYCDAYELYLAACDTLREEGATTKENYTEALRKHPMLQVRKDTIADMNTLEKKLGLTPYSRDRIEPADSSNKEEKRDPMAQFLNRKN